MGLSVIEGNQPKGFRPKMKERKLRSCLYWEGALKGKRPKTIATGNYVCLYKGAFFSFLLPLSMQIVKKQQIAKNPDILHKFKKPARMEIFGSDEVMCRGREDVWWP